MNQSIKYDITETDNWNVNSLSSIYLGVSDAPNANGFSNVAAHEFGHALGLLDAHIHFPRQLSQNGNVLPDFVAINGVEFNDIMWGGDRSDTSFVTDLNRKMALDAFVENRHQGYRDEYVGSFLERNLNINARKNRHIP
ncbi:UNVERIFIED_CONTAM: hypothetical protein Cloal_0451 [Acetivibrio alkalicellulosi]